jgi:hypothetical protein
MYDPQYLIPSAWYGELGPLAMDEELDHAPWLWYGGCVARKIITGKNTKMSEVG